MSLCNSVPLCLCVEKTNLVVRIIFFQHRDTEKHRVSQRTIEKQQLN